jgi:hypothetical protein
MTPDCTLIARNAAEIVAVTPYLMGFHPSDSVVVVGLAGDHVMFGARLDLPSDDQLGLFEIATLIARQHVPTVAVLGYGPEERVKSVAVVLGAELRCAGIRILDVIRVTDGRWWSLYCRDPECCPPEGHPCRPEDSVAAAEAVYQGRVALPDRRALVARVAAVEGAARAEMTAATERVRERFGDAIDQPGQWIALAGRRAVREAERQAESGRPVTADQVARLGVLLSIAEVLDYALDRPGTEEWRLQLWIDVLRRVEPAYVPAPACLTGYVAWRMGDGPLARVALDRAFKADPRHRMAGVLDRVLSAGVGPASLITLRPPGSPGRRSRPRGRRWLGPATRRRADRPSQDATSDGRDTPGGA